MNRNDLDAIDADTRGLVYISDGTRGADRIGRLVGAVPALIAEIRELRTWQEAVALGTGYAEEAHGLINIAPAQVIVDGFREATLGGPEEIPCVDNPVQNDPESFAVDNATRVYDPTDGAGYGYPACDRGPCGLAGGHPGRCQM